MCLQWLRFKVTLQELEHAGISSNLQTLWKTQHVWKWKQENLSPCYSLGTCISGFGGHPSLCGFAFLLRARLVSWLVVVVPSGKVDDKLGGCGLQAGWARAPHDHFLPNQTTPNDARKITSTQMFNIISWWTIPQLSLVPWWEHIYMCMRLYICTACRSNAAAFGGNGESVIWGRITHNIFRPSRNQGFFPFVPVHLCQQQCFWFVKFCQYFQLPILPILPIM